MTALLTHPEQAVAHAPAGRAPAARRIRLVLVISNLEFGGAQRQVVELANHLDPEQFDVHVCSLSDYVPLAKGLRRPERLHVVRKRQKFDITTVVRVARLLRRLQADVVHGFLFDAEITTRLAGRLARTPVVVGSERNCDYVLKRRHWVASKLTRGCLDAVVANSSAGARYHQRLIGVAADRYHVVHNGVDTERFRPANGLAVRRALGLPEDAPLVGMFASYKRQKNHPVFYRAAVRVLEQVPAAHFLVVGDELHGGQNHTDVYKREVAALVEELGVGPRCHALPNAPDPERLYPACDVTVLPSRHEGTPNVLLESMACGVPVVASDIVDNRQIVPDGQVGFVVPLDDCTLLAERIVRLLTDRRVAAADERRGAGLGGTRVLAGPAGGIDERGVPAAAGAVRCGPRAAECGGRWPVSTHGHHRPVATLARYPHPYRAALAVCSDLDETPDRQTYAEIVRFLNTTETTSVGPGVGLEVGNSLYFFGRPGQYSYWTTDAAGRALAQRLIRSGHIDCLHSYGDLATEREHALRALAELERCDGRLRVWVDHSKAPSNFGPDLMCGHGDDRRAQVYHADVTLAYGIQYVWRGRTTAVLGQDRAAMSRGLLHLLRAEHLAASGRTVAKEMAKQALGRLGRARWRLHAANRVLRPARLRDGQPVWEFLRSNPHWAGSGAGATANGIADVLTERMLRRLCALGGACVLYTHLGKVRDARRPFGPQTVAAFRRLAAAQAAGEIFVTTTLRLLRYLTMRDTLRYSTEWRHEGVGIVLHELADPVLGVRLPSLDELRGLTFVLPRVESVTLRRASGAVVPCTLDHRGRTTIVSVPWQPLGAPELDDRSSARPVPRSEPAGVGASR